MQPLQSLEGLRHCANGEDGRNKMMNLLPIYGIKLYNHCKRLNVPLENKLRKGLTVPPARWYYN